MRKHIGVIVAGIAAMTLFAGSASAATEVDVDPGNMDGWAFQTSSTATAGMVSGPAPTPLGTGSARFSVGPDGNGAAQLRNSAYHGTRLDALTELSYATYVEQDGSGGQAPYLILHIDHDGDGAADDLLFFEPVYQTATFFPSNPQPALAMNTWQTWDALNGGWWSVNGIAGATPGTGVKSIADYLAAEPDATIVNAGNGAGGVRIVTGFGAGAWDNFIGNADAFAINGTTYDFEAVPTDKDSCKKGGWTAFTSPSFKNQGQCIQYVKSGK